MALLNHRPVWALTIAAPLLAMVSTASYAQTWKINLRDADLTAFILCTRQISQNPYPIRILPS